MKTPAGEIVYLEISSAKEKQRIEVGTDEIEELLRSRFERGGWDVEFDWPAGQWPRMEVTRTRKVASEQ